MNETVARRMRVTVEEFTDDSKRRFVTDIGLNDSAIDDKGSWIGWRKIVQETLVMARIASDRIGRK